jgi:NADPH:quinone reductase-like Zn-dependent oxidoreductase
LEYGGELVFQDVPMPAIGGDEILVKVKQYRRQSPGSCFPASKTDTPDRSALVPGHEFSGSSSRLAAASVPVAAQTAWYGLVTHGHLERANDPDPWRRRRCG